jgi:hypothetical protein
MGGSPHLGEDQAVLVIHILALDIPCDITRLVVTKTSGLEGDVGRSEGLDLEGGTGGRVIFGEDVGGGLAEVLGWISIWMRGRWGRRDGPSKTGERVGT